MKRSAAKRNKNSKKNRQTQPVEAAEAQENAADASSNDETDAAFASGLDEAAEAYEAADADAVADEVARPDAAPDPDIPADAADPAEDAEATPPEDAEIAADGLPEDAETASDAPAEDQPKGKKRRGKKGRKGKKARAATDGAEGDEAGDASSEGSDAPADDADSADAAVDAAAAAKDPGPTSFLVEVEGEAREISAASVVEAVLFASDSPLPAKKIANILGVGDVRDVRRHIETLNEEYAATGRSFRIEEIAKGYQMLTQPAYNGWLTKVLRTRSETKLSPAALETLAIVAYKQPLVRADIEAIRGVACGDMVNKLREMNLVKIVGRADDIGRPILYGTTSRFLEVFGLGSLEDLPKSEELSLPQ